ncbi:caspase recruitment domain-containing protein 9 isoform 2-T2 [Dama dama]|uniref:caspase recruitment domain-containing protein 9 isoform X2 n=1 Tax=Dama dama TaxID=30532 RepID=UPI002A3612E4|nr:caspase recruitment domain-containing protein 9 isoform X2 [Dama dama]
MSDYENEDACWSALEGFRVKLISIIDPARITPYLRQCKVMNPDDEEQVLSDPNLVTRKRKVGVLLDILQRTGHKGYVAFLESLELYYPQLYRKVTGKEPTRVFSMIIDASGESGLTQLLMSEVMKLQKKVQELTALLGSRDDLAEELRVKDSLLRKLQERVQRLKEACEAGSRELQRCKDENYDLALRLARQSEERDAALTGHRGLLLEIDQLKHSLMKAEDDCRVERKHTLKLRHAMELRPSQELLWELQQEKALLQARVQGLEASVQEGKPDQGHPYVQVPEGDWQRAQRDLQQQAATIFSLRKDLRQAEALRTRSAEEKEMFELQCLALRRDSKMYKDRIEAILRQMEEVAIERDQVGTRWPAWTHQPLWGGSRQGHPDAGGAACTARAQSAGQGHAAEAGPRAEREGGRAPAAAVPARGPAAGHGGQAPAAAAGRAHPELRPGRQLTQEFPGGQRSDRPMSLGKFSPPQDLEEDTQLSDKGSLVIGESPEQPSVAQQEEQLSLTPEDAGLNGREPPEKEKGRRRLKESFENYRRKRALRKMQHGARQGEADGENTTGSDNTDTEGA